jgi:glycosyltransferase involved in cell wall biosynthesis
MLTYALCFIVFNEAQGCVLDVPRIDLTQFDQVYAVDGGSTDGTVETLTRFGVRVFKQKQGSLNAAYREAVEACECDNLLIFFPKGTLDLTI